MGPSFLLLWGGGGPGQPAASPGISDEIAILATGIGWMAIIEGLLTRKEIPYGLVNQFRGHHESGLAAVILLWAIRDWRWPSKRASADARARGFKGLREEILEFWDSPWGKNLREWFGLEALDITQVPF